VKWLDGKVAHHKRLRGGVQFVDSIPKNPSGKILRRMLKQQFKDIGKGPKAKL
jgi:acyl-coenzyme A synthetase/AMP-(fatty) acid ligase